MPCCPDFAYFWRDAGASAYRGRSRAGGLGDGGFEGNVVFFLGGGVDGHGTFCYICPDSESGLAGVLLDLGMSSDCLGRDGGLSWLPFREGAVGT